ncbi:hypothetical protein B484DRAFT_58893 [Ochromonadaceae sp. CCMP2298]|nr:hypothetical protein B484DRAFT_58893 [Ochromonadaceae sp. CCMP2298]
MKGHSMPAPSQPYAPLFNPPGRMGASSSSSSSSSSSAPPGAPKGLVPKTEYPSSFNQSSSSFFSSFSAPSTKETVPLPVPSSTPYTSTKKRQLPAHYSPPSPYVPPSKKPSYSQGNVVEMSANVTGTGKRWTAEDDERLWSLRSLSTQKLMGEFGREAGGIRARLKHLDDPDHNASKRLSGASSQTQSYAPPQPYAPPYQAYTPSYPPLPPSPPQAYVPPYEAYAPSAQAYVPSEGAGMPVKANASRQAYAPMFQAQLSEAQTLKQGAGSIEEGVTQEGVQEGTQGTEQALSLEQSQCLSLVLSRSANIFITGAAGTGKSFLLRRIIEQLPQKGEKIGR